MSRSGYWALPESDRNGDNAHVAEHVGDTEDLIPPVYVETGRAKDKSQWSQIADLDDFFRRVYRYHQRHGFLAILFEDCLKLMQYMFVVIFSMYLTECVRYDQLFHWFEETIQNTTSNIENGTIHFHPTKVSLSDTVLPLGQCISEANPWLNASVIIAMFFWLFWLIKIAHSAVKNLEVRRFYHEILQFADSDLPDLTWNKDILPRIISVQQEVELCVHKVSLTELDICQRILRFNNYMAAMVYRTPEPLLPLKLNIMCVGHCFYVSTGLKTCLEMVLFWKGPFSPFDTNWHLREEFRRMENRERLASQLRRRAAFLGVINLIFLPIIFIWQLLYLFLSYTTLIRKDPTWLGSRRWSEYGRLYGRLFNELDHQLDARLSRAYDQAKLYMASFPPHPIVIILCRGLLFFSSSILAVLLVLTLIDNDVLRVEGMMALMAALGLIATLAGAVLPDENLVYAPDLLLNEVQRHYRHLPNEWLAKAHSRVTRDEFASLFQYKAVWLLEELSSPFVSVYILLFKFRSAALPIVDFLRNFTVDVVGVGDVCSFALMNIDAQTAQSTVPSPPPVSQPPKDSSSKPGGHGAAAGSLGYGATKPGLITAANALQQAPPEAKLEMSLAQFALANPNWRPDGGQNQRSVVSKVRNDAALAASVLQQQQQQVLSSMMVPGIMMQHDQMSSFRPAMDPSFFYTSTTTQGGGIQGSQAKLRGPGVSRLDDYPSLIAPVMDRRLMMTTSSAENSLIAGQPSVFNKPPRLKTMSGSDNGLEMEEYSSCIQGPPGQHPLSTSGPALGATPRPSTSGLPSAVVRQEHETGRPSDEIDPFASLAPLGMPVWSPPVNDTLTVAQSTGAPRQLHGYQGHELIIPDLGEEDDDDDAPPVVYSVLPELNQPQQRPSSGSGSGSGLLLQHNLPRSGSGSQSSQQQGPRS